MKFTIVLVISLILFCQSLSGQVKRKFKHPYGFGSAFGCFAKGKKVKKYRESNLFRKPNRPYLAVGPRFGPSFLMGDFGGQWGRGTAWIKDLDFRASKNSMGGIIRLHPLNNVYIELGADWMQLYSNDRFSQEPDRRRRDAYSSLNLIEGNIGVYFHTGEIFGFSLHIGTGGFFYSLSGVSGENTSAKTQDYSSEGSGWLMSASFSKMVSKHLHLFLGTTHRSVFHDLLDNYKIQQNDAYFTVFLGCIWDFKLPKRRVQSCKGFE